MLWPSSYEMPVLGHVKTLECRVAALMDAASDADDGLRRVHELIASTSGDAVSLHAAQWTPRRLAPALASHWPFWGAQSGSCAIHCAATAGANEVIELILAHDIPVDTATRQGATALMLAAFCGHSTVVETLLLANASVDTRLCGVNEHMGPTALHLACCADDDVECVRLLLAARASVDVTASGPASGPVSGQATDLCVADGRTPLHMAAASGNVRVCAELVAAGAWVHVEDTAAETPLQIARMSSARRLARADDVVRELCWLPCVRLLWLGQRAPPPSPPHHTDSEDSDASLLPLRQLTPELVRLIASMLISSHAPAPETAISPKSLRGDQ